MATGIERGIRGLGWLAIAWISLIMLAHAAHIVTLISDFIRHSDPSWQADGYWVLPTFLGFAVLSISGLGLLLARRKAGLYLFLAAQAVTVGYALGYLQLPGRIVLPSLLPPLAAVAILGLVLYPRWDVQR